MALSLSVPGRAGGSYKSVPEEVLRQATAELPSAEVSVDTTVAEALVKTGLVRSLSEARRTIGQGGASVDGERVTAEDATLAEFASDRTLLVLGRGKKQKAALTIAQ